jgi:CheY-like chemotaxis protein
VDQAYLGTETIILVEDDPAVSAMSQRILKQCGYKVISRNDGLEAVEYAEKNGARDIQLLFTDVIMPKMNGKEAAEKIQAINPDIKVLYCSGYSQDTMLQQGTIGVDFQMIQKPFSPAALTKKVREVLDQDKKDKNKKGPSGKKRS